MTLKTRWRASKVWRTLESKSGTQIWCYERQGARGLVTLEEAVGVCVLTHLWGEACPRKTVTALCLPCSELLLILKSKFGEAQSAFPIPHPLPRRQITIPVCFFRTCCSHRLWLVIREIVSVLMECLLNESTRDVELVINFKCVYC